MAAFGGQSHQSSYVGGGDLWGEPQQPPPRVSLRYLRWALLISAVFCLVAVLVLSGCGTWVDKAQEGRGITPAEAAGGRYDRMEKD